jgi:hypothetical protein
MAWTPHLSPSKEPIAGCQLGVKNCLLVPIETPSVRCWNRVGTLELWQRDGADPVELLSTWERERLERLLAGL